ncbi:aldo/keto reductase [Aquabacter sp. CN5-332]|uniref:aldo/keto reductase n=1 Tax=Aquabacter sp. CN5-332 TaxID=3156608 RepID=UPI0032B4BCC9
MDAPKPEFTTDRRSFLGASAVGALATAMAAAPLAAGIAQAQTNAPAAPSGGASSQPVITRTIPSSNEAIPALGLGTFIVFDLLPGAKRDNLRDVMKTYFDAGARVVDTSPLYGSAQYSVGQLGAALGITERMFIANKVWATGEYLGDESHARRSLELSQRAIWKETIDVMHVHSLVNVDLMLPYLRAWKKEGLIRYTAVSHFENPYHEPLAQLVEAGNLDIVQVNYSIFNRAAEQRILPTARDKGIAVFTNMPFEKARLFQVVQGRPLPDFAREFGAQTWAEFFLKWVISHPAVTCTLAATSDPAHAAENVGALRGPLPDAQMRQRMVRHMEGLPGFDRIASVPWYPGKAQMYQGLIRRSQGQLRQRLS